MDARITKQRLSNLFSYDWLKMVVTIVVVVLLLVLLFTMSATRPTRAQEFAIYAYSDLQQGSQFNTLTDRLREKKVLSYDVLALNAESFAGNQYAAAAFNARRGAGQGNVMFLTDNTVYETDEAGNVVKDEKGEPVVVRYSELDNIALGATHDAVMHMGGVFDTFYYMDLCEGYLEDFFGEDWATSDVFDGSVTVEQAFSRNDGDKRYRKPEQRAAGLVQEEQRIRKLREDYLVVEAALERGTITHTTREVKRSSGETYTAGLGLNVGELAGLKKLVYYMDGDKQTTKNVNLVFFYNGEHDLCFEPISLVRYLLDSYTVA